jgi:hypothetical protein
MIDYTKILNVKYAGSQWTLNGDDYEGLTWLSDTPKPTKKQLDDLWESVQEQLEQDKQDKKLAKVALLERLGLTQDEFNILTAQSSAIVQ